jgi:hypothetical protein
LCVYTHFGFAFVRSALTIAALSTISQEERDAHKGAAEDAQAAAAQREELQVEAAAARDSLAAEAAAKAELEARVAALEADLAGALAGLEVGGGCLITLLRRVILI